MDVVRVLIERLLDVVRNGHVAVLPKHFDSGTVLALAAGTAVVVGAWALVIMIALELRSKQDVLSKRPRD